MSKYIITIARTYGSGGKEIGKALAASLGIRYYGREIWEMLHSSDTIFNEDESVLNASKEVFESQSKTIREIASKESCVIVGRCGDYVLKDMDNVAKLYIYAPPRECLRRVIKLYELNPDEAKQLINSMNKTRGTYYSIHTGQERDNPANYDMCLSTAGLSTEESVEIIKQYLKIRFHADI